MATGRDEMDAREAEMITVGKRIRAALDADAGAGDDVRLGRQRFVDYVTSRDVSKVRVRRTDWFMGVRRLSFGLVGAGAVAAAVLVWMRLPISFQVDSDAGPG